MATKKINLAVASLAFIVAACGDTNTIEGKSSLANTSNLDYIEDVNDLPECNESNDKQMVWVQNESTPRVCSGNKWFAVTEESSAAVCKTEPLHNGSGIKIVCGGDSIGVVYNGIDGVPGIAGKDGKDGVDGKDGEQGEKGDKGDAGINGADGKDGVDGKDGANGKDGIDGKDGVSEVVDSPAETISQDTIALDSEKVAVSLNEVSGVTQKGPFLSGSRVLVREMEDGRTLTQTGNSFNGKILNDNGEFKIKARMLVSQYVMLEASGYYRNEITGENSNSELTLFAITDVSDRNVVNINLLTHLEYERVIYLVTHKKMKVKAAKRQAQKEVFDLLHIDATDFSNSEDLNIAGASDEDGALLAFSVILQGDRSESQLTELLTKIALDMEEDGSWDNASMRTALADWAAEKELAGKMATIRQNVANWKLSSIVPNFEKHIHKFWTTEYGLESCTADNEGVVLQNSNKLSKSIGTYFICKSGKWTTASTIEYDTYKWSSGKDGDNKPGSVNTDNCYVFEKDVWRSGNSSDCSLGLRGCTALRQDTVGKGKDGVWYKCDSQTWYAATNIEKDTATWGAGNFDGEVRAGQINKAVYYIYETSNKAWRNATTLEKDTYDYKNNKDWADGVDGEIKKGSITDSIYVFDKTAWRTANSVESVLGGCIATIADSVGKVDNTYYICKSRSWTVASEYEYDTYRWKTGVDGEIKKGNVSSVIYVFDKTAWRVADNIEKYLGGCVTTIQDSVGKVGSTYYICKLGKWDTATQFEYDTYRWTVGKDGEIKKGNVSEVIYIYDKDSWKVAGRIEGKLGGCVKAIQDSIGKVGNTFYKCDSNNTWVEASEFEYDTYRWGVGKDGEIRKGRVTDSVYVYYEAYWDYYLDKLHPSSWQRADSVERELGGCVQSSQDSVGKVGDVYYICKLETMDVEEYCMLWGFYGDRDYSDLSGQYIKSNECDGMNYAARKWRHAIALKYDTYKACNEFRQIVQGNVNKDREYLCTSKRSAVPYSRSEDNNAIISQFEDKRDGKIYRSIKYRMDESNYGKTVTYYRSWMIDDLDYVDENMPPYATKCYGTNCEQGREYTWATAIDSSYWAQQGKTCGNTTEPCDLSNNKVRGICPDGWHIPNETEWNAVRIEDGGAGANAFNMWWYNSGSWWSSSEYSGDVAWTAQAMSPPGFWDFRANSTEGKAYYSKIRCVKDDEE